MALQNVLGTTFLGHRSGHGPLHRGSEYLEEDLVARGELTEAVRDALRNMALEWRYLHPDIPG
ncbi:hypothetical protein [Streptomyces sp. YIM 98790]|uniref:hypothetical protein n=1 Tax=Streptomyces sp. YIM 98790 TaxID=2689077 RepID=UPI00140C0C3D|nr:hypothetical protein [Streptomyces sp. YIM 98790]